MPQKLGADSVGTVTRNSGTQVQLAASSKITIGGQQYTNSAILFINTGGTGAGGLDTGTLGTNQTWYIHAVLSGGVMALVASLSKTAPTGFATFTWTGWAFVTGTGSTILFVSSDLTNQKIVITYNAYTNSGAVNTSVGDTILWSTVEEDIYALMVSGLVTVPLTGLWEVRCNVPTAEAATTAAQVGRVFKNGSIVRSDTVHAPATSGRSIDTHAAFLGHLNAGDTINVNAVSPFGNLTYSASSEAWFEMKRISS